MNHDYDDQTLKGSDGKKSPLTIGNSIIRRRQHRAAEYQHGFLERETVLGKIDPVLCVVPLELHCQM